MRQINRTEAVGVLALSPDGKTFAVVSTTKSVFNHPNGQSTAIMWLSGKTVSLVDVARGKVTQRLEGHASGTKGLWGVNVLAFAPDNNILVTVDKRVHFWDVATGKEVPNRWLSADQVSVLAFAPDGKTLATAAPTPWYACGISRRAQKNSHNAGIWGA